MHDILSFHFSVIKTGAEAIDPKTETSKEPLCRYEAQEDKFLTRVVTRDESFKQQGHSVLKEELAFVKRGH